MKTSLLAVRNPNMRRERLLLIVLRQWLSSLLSLPFVSYTLCMIPVGCQYDVLFDKAI